MHLSWEKLKANDGIDNDDKDDEKSNVKQRHHSFQNSIQYHL